MNRLSDIRIKEADAVLKALRSSIVPISIGGIHHKISQVGGPGDFDIMSTLVFHYGLVKRDEGCYRLTEEGKKAADIGFKVYSMKRDQEDQKKKRPEKQYQQRSRQDAPQIVFVERRGMEFWGIDWDEWKDLIGLTIAALTLAVACAGL